MLNIVAKLSILDVFGVRDPGTYSIILSPKQINKREITLKVYLKQSLSEGMHSNLGVLKGSVSSELWLAGSMEIEENWVPCFMKLSKILFQVMLS